MSKPTLFISYRRDDNADATGRLYDRLEAHFGGERVFYDIDAIPFGVDFREHLGEAVGKCDVLLAVIGEAWLALLEARRRDGAPDFVRVEIESALARGIPVIPVLVGRATMPGEQKLPESLKPLAFRNAAEVLAGPTFNGQVGQLIRGIELLHARLKPAVAVPPPKKIELPKAFENSIGMRFVLIEPGTFLMGSPPSDDERFGDETQHQVTLTKAFYLGVHPVTQGQWQAVMGTNPSYFNRGGGGKDKVKDISDADLAMFPVESVLWEDAQAFLKKLAATKGEAKSGMEYRLPTEAEWEYSCRNSATEYQKYHFGNSISPKQANYHDSNLVCTSRVGSYPANAWGLHDMHGNVWEWCADWYGEYPDEEVTDPSGPSDGAVRVIRGGSWDFNGLYCRAAYRNWSSPSSRNFYLGFRVAAVPR